MVILEEWCGIPANCNLGARIVLLDRHDIPLWLHVIASAAGGSETILTEAQPDSIYSAELQGDSFRLLQISSSLSSA